MYKPLHHFIAIHNILYNSSANNYNVLYYLSVNVYNILRYWLSI